MPLEQKETSKEFKLVKGGKFHWYIYGVVFLIYALCIKTWADYRSNLLERFLSFFPSNEEKTVFFFVLCLALVVLAVVFTEAVFFLWDKISEVKRIGLRIILSDLLTAIYICVLILFIYAELATLPANFYDKGLFSIAILRTNESIAILFALVPISMIAFYLIKFKKKEFIRIRTKIFFEQTDKN